MPQTAGKQAQRIDVRTAEMRTVPRPRQSTVPLLRKPSSSYYRARYYDASTGRFSSEDPIGFKAKQINFYSYVSNNPVNLLDPMGLKSWNKVQNFMNCLDGCVKAMVDLNFCTLKKNLIRTVITGPLIGVATCTLIVVSEPYLAPAYLPCVGLTVGSTLAIMTSGSIGRWNLENLSSGVGCTTFCAMNELR
jgi:hypothetical protein